MAHFSLYVLYPGKEINRQNAEELITPIMYRYQEEFGDLGEEWDWFRIGGSCSGMLTGYEPRDNKNNWELCSNCKGKGFIAGRDKDKVFEKCNWCRGKGERLKGAEDWDPHDGDVMPIESLDIYSIIIPYAVLTSDDKWFANEEWHKEGEKERWEAALRLMFRHYSDCSIVVVDCHC